MKDSRHSIRSILLEAAKLIKESGWCQGHMALDKNGKPTNHLASGACDFCMTGALDRAAYDLDATLDLRDEAECAALENVAAYVHLTDFNDNARRTKGEVISVLKDAAEETLNRF